MIGNPNTARRLQFAAEQHIAEAKDLQATVWIKRRELHLPTEPAKLPRNPT